MPNLEQSSRGTNENNRLGRGDVRIVHNRMLVAQSKKPNISALRRKKKVSTRPSSSSIVDAFKIIEAGDLWVGDCGDNAIEILKLAHTIDGSQYPTKSQPRPRDKKGRLYGNPNPSIYRTDIKSESLAIKRRNAGFSDKVWQRSDGVWELVIYHGDPDKKASFLRNIQVLELKPGMRIHISERAGRTLNDIPTHYPYAKKRKGLTHVLTYAGNGYFVDSHNGKARFRGVYPKRREMLIVLRIYDRYQNIR